MEQPPESTRKEGEIEVEKAAANSRGPVSGFLGQARNTLLLGAGIFVTGCDGEKTEAPKPPDGLVAIVTTEKTARPPEGEKCEGGIPKAMDGGTKKEGKTAETKEETIETKQVAVIRQGHVEVDGRYYLKTKDWDKETVWVLHKGDRLPKLDTLEEISAEFRGKNMKYAGRYYSKAEDPMAWERGVEATEKGATPPLVTETMKAAKKIEEIPPEIQMPLGENAVRLQNPATIQCKEGIFLVDSDGRRLWRLVDGPMLFGRCGTVDRPCIDGGVVYGTRASVMYDGKTTEQITTCYVGRRPNGTPYVTLVRKWILDTTIGDLKKRLEAQEEHQREQKRQEALEQVNRLVQIVSIRGKTFTDQRGVVWTHAGGYFPSLSLGRLHNTKISAENPQWGRDARGADILIGGTQVLRWKVDGKDVEFRAPVEQKKGGTRTPERPGSDTPRMA